MVRLFLKERGDLHRSSLLNVAVALLWSLHGRILHSEIMSNVDVLSIRPSADVALSGQPVKIIDQFVPPYVVLVRSSVLVPVLVLEFV
ncbi:unnamed protein product [Linum trigynum]|uniref:Secreted protein n=1 Tax=Linum trigynum TaxID=586398 RepID=A0AAV2G9K5_9ROSI